MAEKFPVGANYLIIAAETITDIADFPRMIIGISTPSIWKVIIKQLHII